MTISEKVRFNAAKRHIKEEYNRCIKLYEGEEDIEIAYGYKCAAKAYFDCYKQLCFDQEVTDDMFLRLITIKSND